MSNRKKPKKGPGPNRHEHEHDLGDGETAVWIRSVPAGKTFIAVLESTDDSSLPLTFETSAAYAQSILAAVARAEYDAIVLRQLSDKLKLDLQTAGQMVGDLRADRPPAVSSFPLRLKPGVNSKKEPFLTVEINGEDVGQWDLEAARKHALAALEAPYVADLDAGYLRALIGVVGVEEHVARNVVADLEVHRG